MLNLPQNLWLEWKGAAYPSILSSILFPPSIITLIWVLGENEKVNEPPLPFFPFALSLTDIYWSSFESIFPLIPNYASTYLALTSLVTLQTILQLLFLQFRVPIHPVLAASVFSWILFILHISAHRSLSQKNPPWQPSKWSPSRFLSHFWGQASLQLDPSSGPTRLSMRYKKTLYSKCISAWVGWVLWPLNPTWPWTWPKFWLVCFVVQLSTMTHLWPLPSQPFFPGKELATKLSPPFTWPRLNLAPGIWLLSIWHMPPSFVVDLHWLAQRPQPYLDSVFIKADTLGLPRQ